jgi:hypothetical protein
MPTLVLDPQPRELRELLEHRKRSGMHRLDEVWEGVLHVVSAQHAMHWLALDDNEYRDVQRSGLIGLGPVELAAHIDWP